LSLTAETIRATEDEEALIGLLAVELQSLLPIEIQKDRELFHHILASLPRGLRAMAGTHEFDVSMTQEDLAMHIACQHDERDLRETINGLRELELAHIAELLEQAITIMAPHMAELHQQQVSAENLQKWLDTVGAQDKIDPLNDIIWDFSAEAGPLGMHRAWVLYAQKYPERCIVVQA
jgi:hypothetical protein